MDILRNLEKTSDEKKNLMIVGSLDEFLQQNITQKEEDDAQKK